MGKKKRYPKTQKLQPARVTDSVLRQTVADAVTAAAKYNINVTYAAFLLALHRQFGFSEVRCQRVLDEVDKLIFEAFDTQSLKEQVLKETKIDLTKVYEEVNNFERYFNPSY